MTGAWPESKALRVRPKPLLSVQVVTDWPSAYGSVSASYQSWSPLMNGGAPALPAAVTTAVCADVATTLPMLFVPVTSIRSVEPTSAAARTRVRAVAPAIGAQAFPAASQRCHCCVKVIVAVPVQVPRFPVRVEPTCGKPVIDGSTVFRGGAAVTSTGVDPAAALPAEFVAVTVTATVEPTSVALIL